MLIFTLNNVYSQDLNNLDNKMGFNKFKLESSFELYKSKLKFTNVGSNKVKLYDYTGDDIKTIFGIPVYKINLAFYKNRLYNISICFLNPNEAEQAKLRGSLIELFGYVVKDNDAKTNSDVEYDWAMLWESKKVRMQVVKYATFHSPTPLWTTEIFMYSKLIHSQVQNDSF